MLVKYNQVGTKSEQYSMLKMFCIFFLHLFIFERERQSTSGGGAERVGDTESEAGYRL